MQERTPSENAMPLPLLDADQAARLQPLLGAGMAPGERDHEDATWYRLVTALASCSNLVTGHTEPPDPHRAGGRPLVDRGALEPPGPFRVAGPARVHRDHPSARHTCTVIDR